MSDSSQEPFPGFSLDASVRIAGHDRAGLERLRRYCARPPFALERLEQVNEHQIIYRLPNPRLDGRTALSPPAPPLEFIDHLAHLIPQPRRHRHRYHGPLAPKTSRNLPNRIGEPAEPQPIAPVRGLVLGPA